jgi:hypothetical protein
MALIRCEECGGKVSTEAASCPVCGRPVKKGSAVKTLALVLVGLFVVVWIVNGMTTDDGGGTSSQAAPAGAPAQAAAATQATMPQEEFESARISQLAAYRAAINEIQKSAVFNMANEDTNAIVARYGQRIANWGGRIDSITTSHGGKDVSISIESANGVTYRIDDDAPAGSRIYDQVSSLQKGQEVKFSGVLQKRGSSPDKWERSLTESGSLDGPVFRVRFESIEAYAGQAAAPTPRPAAADVPEAPALASPTSPPPAAAAEQLVRHPSFDCASARSVPELLICGDDELAVLDVEISGLLAQARQEAVDKKALADSTRAAWNWREKNCQDKQCLVSWFGERKGAYLAAIQESQQQDLKSGKDSI